MSLPLWNIRIALLAVLTLALPSDSTPEKPVRVRNVEGLTHGFLVLRTLDGETLADGDLVQTGHGSYVTSRLVFHFKDGSVSDESVVFSQRVNFRLLKYHLVQKGPIFPHPLDFTIDPSKKEVTVHYSEDGKEKVANQHPDLPVDLANGMVLILLKNVSPETPETRVAMLAATPKPQLVRLIMTPQGEDSLKLGGSARKAIHYVVKVEIGGVKGLIAPIVGKQPPDIHVWILGGEAPTFVRSEAPLYIGGPIWRTELVSPVWPQASSEGAKDKEKDKSSH
jgi:hypothetical protein